MAFNFFDKLEYFKSCPQTHATSALRVFEVKEYCFLGCLYSFSDFKTWVAEVNGIYFLVCVYDYMISAFEVEQHWHLCLCELIET
ncbi:hypothetical protein I3843_07G146300 [Carya illinoinensis]|uniref:Uncharacterized protein n=1 Tax=Carya illinoinensis TaxID=32201 RepID=A0A8T1PV60_CARIL|nr:hypothetical protein CIPAW_07G148000 [Carya illinoinensis]KAG7971652.1 hypothetical protein I3843_07G146300 [Carya illinoinensis]